LKIVDGELMIKAVQEQQLVSTTDSEEINAMRNEASNLYELSRRYSQAGFSAMGEKQLAIGQALHAEVTKGESEMRSLEWREKGKFVISEPEWDATLEMFAETGNPLFVPYKFVTVKEKIGTHMDYQALYKVNIQNWVGDVPIQVLEVVEEMRYEFSELSIWFVARRSAVKDLIANFVKQDPILCGKIGDNYVVLKMWGDDLEEMSLALIDPTLESNL